MVTVTCIRVKTTPNVNRKMDDMCKNSDAVFTPVTLVFKGLYTLSKDRMQVETQQDSLESRCEQFSSGVHTI